MAKILLVEDEPKTIQFIKQGLQENGFEVDEATDGITGKQLALRNKYDLIISDIILPGLDGRTLCKELRSAKVETAILMLSALSSTDDVVTGLDIGADDYLTKPFEFRELLARIRVLTKRKKGQAEGNVLAIADLEMNLSTKSVKRGVKQIELTQKEFALLEYLLVNRGRVISRAELAKNIWKIDFDTGTNTVEVYVNYLRKKIDRDFEPKLIHTQFGFGYTIKGE